MAPLPTQRNVVKISVEAARKETERRSSTVLALYEQLHELIIRHEHTIRRRWSKKPGQQRINLVMEVRADIPRPHRPDMEILQNHLLPNGPLRPFLVTTDQKKWSLLCPHVNLEDLAGKGPQNLLLFLNSRGRNHPAAFADFDWEAMRLGSGVGLLQAAVLPNRKHNIFMDDPALFKGRRYGELISFASVEEADNWIQEGKGYSPDVGLHILEAQESILTFLLDCALKILHDIPPHEITADKYPVQPEPVLAGNKQEGSISSLKSLHEEAAYRLPTKLDLQQLSEVISVRLQAAEDHLLSLREDPVYFHERVNEEMQHAMEMIRGTDGKAHPLLDSQNLGLRATRSMRQAVFDAYMKLHLWGALSEQIKDLIKIQEEYASHIKPTEDLPEPLLVGILSFHHMTDFIAKISEGALYKIFPSSPYWRKCWTNNGLANLTDRPKLLEVKNAVSGLTNTEKAALWFFRNIWENAQKDQAVSVPCSVAHLEKILDEPKNDYMASLLVHETLQDIFLCVYCLEAVISYVPWARSFEMHREKRAEQLTEGVNKKISVLKALDRSFTSPVLLEIAPDTI
jgi:hypothetical protein